MEPESIKKKSNLLIRKEPFGTIVYDKITKRKIFFNNSQENDIRFYKKKIETINKSYPYNISSVSFSLSAPLHIYWELTYKCNLNCKHCYVKDRKLKFKELNINECFKIIDELARLKIFEITFSGGEPLVKKGIINIMKYATKKGINVLLTTNGTLINESIAKKLKYAGLQAVQVSLDGSTASIHDKFRGVCGSFAATINGIKNLIKFDIPVVIATVPTKYNLSEIPKILNLAIKLKVQGFRVLECKPFGRGENILDNFVSLSDYESLINWISKERKKVKNKLFILLSESFAFLINKDFSKNLNRPLIDCPAGRSMCSISPDGLVAPCSYFAFADVTIGNLRKNTLQKIWKESKFLKKLRKIDFSKKSNINKFCLNCRYSNQCGRGCRALAYYINGDLLGLDLRCLKMQNRPKNI